MKVLATAFCLLFTLLSSGQKRENFSLKLLVMQPDTAIIAPILYPEIDSIVTLQRIMQNNTIQLLEEISESDDFISDSLHRNEVKAETKKAKQIYETTSNKIKYFHFISYYSTFILSLKLNVHESLSVIQEVPYQGPDLASLKKLADSASADYILYYTNIHTINKDSNLYLKATTHLYSNIDHKLVLEEELLSNTKDKDEDEWNCKEEGQLACLFQNMVLISTSLMENFIIRTAKTSKQH